MSTSHNFAVIMAGGKGERFWPLSRRAAPKHFHAIVGGKPMLEQTFARFAGLVSPEQTFVITNLADRPTTKAFCAAIPDANIIGEPEGRDTAAAVALAALLVRMKDTEGVLALLPADAAIHNAAEFRAVLGAAFAAAAANDFIYTIGIPPQHPATGYGYLRRGEPMGISAGRPWFRVENFVEKPDCATAEKYLAEQIYFWNAGMFVARASVLEAAFRQHAPAIAAAMEMIEKRLRDGSPMETALAHYREIPKISVDYAVMEKAANVAMIEATFDWDDVGEWPALARHEKPDANKNTVRGEAVLLEARGNIIRNENSAGDAKPHLIALLGVDDLVVVRTADATLICPKNRAQDLKKLLQAIAARPDGARWL